MDYIANFKFKQIVVNLCDTIDRYCKNEEILSDFIKENYTTNVELFQEIAPLIHDEYINNVKSNNEKRIEDSSFIFIDDYNYLLRLICDNEELISQFINDPRIIKINETVSEYTWQCKNLIINIDSYLNLYIKLIHKFRKKRWKKCPAFNCNPKKHFYRIIPECKKMLDNELDAYKNLHSVRNKILHNCSIMDEKVFENLNMDIFNLIKDMKYLSEYKNIPIYCIQCLQIIMLSLEKIFTPMEVSNILDDKKINKYLQIYKNAKDSF